MQIDFLQIYIFSGFEKWKCIILEVFFTLKNL
jgi:hypothetical protein